MIEKQHGCDHFGFREKGFELVIVTVSCSELRGSKRIRTEMC